MRPKTILAVAAAAVALVCLTGWVLRASAATPRARLLTASEMHTLLGGECPEEDCEDQVCDTSECLTQETQCKKKGAYCMMVVTTPFAKCVGGYPNKKCKHQGLVEACAQQYVGMPMGGNCDLTSCTKPYTKCGPQKYKCEADACSASD